jgi:hypothetical protein
VIVVSGRCKRADRNPDAASLGSGQIQVRSLHRVQVRSQALEAFLLLLLLLLDLLPLGLNHAVQLQLIYKGKTEPR